MIKKLSKRIFLLIMTTLSFIILGIIILFAFISYNNTINASIFMIDKIINDEPKKLPNGKIENYKINPEINIDGLYNILIENSTIIQTSNSPNDKKINEYAIKISKQSNTKGIIGKYIYKARKINKNTTVVTFIENENAILHIKVILIFSIVISFISIIVIYAISKKVSKIIVKPVKEAFEKQKQFISDASHELKTPLAVIEANADVLENEINSNKWLRYIQNEISNMNKLINDLLLLAKVENVDNLKEFEQFNLSNELEIVLSMFESIAYENQVVIKNNISKNIMLNGTKEDVQRIVSILLDNAIKHTDAKKEVIVELKCEKNVILLEVKNMGKPIPEAEREKIFERFYRVDKSRNRDEKRYGLGLAIAKSTIEKYNGKIEVYYKDSFTIFKVVFPKLD